MVLADRAAELLADLALPAVDRLALRAMIVLAREDEDGEVGGLAELGVLVEDRDRLVRGGVGPRVEVDDEDGYVAERRFFEGDAVAVGERQRRSVRQNDPRSDR